ncbi:MAG TPA: hypothetical protein VF311_06425 [Terriglobales bacterium]|jgi:hypothetical protein
MLVMILLLVLVPQTRTPGFWSRAEAEIRRLPPSAFTSTPPAIRQQLERIGCTIPQPSGPGGRASKSPSNLIHGDFAAKGQTDWAALCSRQGKSSVVIIWGGPARCPSSFGERRDVDFLQIVEPDQAGFSRGIAAAPGDYILRMHAAFGGAKPPPITHLGIDDEFLGKGSVVFYCDAGKWLQLTGMD